MFRFMVLPWTEETWTNNDFHTKDEGLFVIFTDVLTSTVPNENVRFMEGVSGTINTLWCEDRPSLCQSTISQGLLEQRTRNDTKHQGGFKSTTVTDIIILRSGNPPPIWNFGRDREIA